ncbi:MAG: S8 family serine peptidase [Caldilineaceae bacterium]
MKVYLLLVCLLSLLPLPLHAQAAPKAQVRVIVTLRNQADLSAVQGRDPHLRRRQTVALLKATAGDTARAQASTVAMRAAAGEAVSEIIPFWIFNGFAITASPSVIARLAASPDVLRITPDDIDLAPASTLAEMEDTTANLSVVQAPSLWGLGWRGQGVVVASLDTGVDVTHPDLASNWRGGTNSWFDPFDQHPMLPNDPNGHGTWTMGVMVGGSTSGTAIGVAPAAKWIAARIFDDSGRSSATAVHRAYQWLLDPDGDPATDDAPDVVNNSWTFTSSGCHLEFEQDLQALRAGGILPIFAAGNSGSGAGTSLSPGNNPSAFAVGATDNADQIYSGSSRGPSSCDGSLFPEITAPGVSIHSSSLNGAYFESTGTSLAAPHVTGVLAVLLSAYRDLPIEQQQAALNAGVTDLGPLGADNVFGAGRLNGLASYAWLASNGFVPQSQLSLPIHTIQGAGHTSPLVGQLVTTEGIVTAIVTGRGDDGFYLQSPAADADDGTSEAIYVATGQPASVAPGDAVRVAALVSEFKPQGTAGNELSVTQLVSPSITIYSTGNALPPSIVIGADGRNVPANVIEDDAMALFDPNSDGLDFFESLESMRVQVNNAVVVGPGSADRLAGAAPWVLADSGTHAGPASTRGGIIATGGDFNPERIRLGGDLYPVPGGLPPLNVGVRIDGPVVGVLDYQSANYALLVTSPLAVDIAGQVTYESAGPAANGSRFTAAAYHVGGLGGDADDTAFARRAAQIVDNLAAPGVVLLEGVLDDTGSADSGDVTAAAAFARLIEAVQSAGGPAYQYAQIDPADNADGGTGDNARLGFLFDPARVTLEGTPARAGIAAAVTCDQGRAHLSYNPGRIDPGNNLWSGSRKPLALQVQAEGASLFIIGIDLVSKAADSPLYGSLQPPLRPSDAVRYAQTTIVSDFVQQILACEKEANVLVLGNGNDQPEAGTLAPLYQAGLHNLADVLPAAERYTSVVDGNSQLLQQAFASSALLAAQPAYDVIHINAEFANRVSDHDPVWTSFTLPVPAGIAPRAYLAYIGH